MLFRTSLAALGIFAFIAAAPVVATHAAAQQSTTTAGSRDSLRPPQDNATIERATTSISCTSSSGRTVTYTLSVRGGSCIAADLGSLTGSGGRANNASGSSSGNGDEASATCSQGCGRTTGQGSCTQN